jgi:ArsR family transcriptional regulator
MIKEVEKLFKAFSDVNRIRILKILELRPFCVCELTAVLELAQSTVSEHLQNLKNAGLVEDTQNGWFIDYRLCPVSMSAAAKAMLAILKNNLKDDTQIRKDRARAQKINRDKLCCKK